MCFIKTGFPKPFTKNSYSVPEKDFGLHYQSIFSTAYYLCACNFSKSLKRYWGRRFYPNFLKTYVRLNSKFHSELAKVII